MSFLSVRAKEAIKTALAIRIVMVHNAGKHPQAEGLVNELHDDIFAWQVLIEKEFGLWAVSPETAIASSVDLSDRLIERLRMLEKRSQEIFDFEDKGALTSVDYEKFYRLLGSFRGLSESGAKFMQLAEKIDWPHWQEARF